MATDSQALTFELVCCVVLFILTIACLIVGMFSKRYSFLLYVFAALFLMLFFSSLCWLR